MFRLPEWLRDVLPMSMLMVLVCLILAPLFWLSLDGFRSISKARFATFYVCDGPDPVTGLPQEPKTIWSPTTEKIYVCGYFEVRGWEDVYLLLLYEDEPVGYFGDCNRCRTGYLFEEVPPRIHQFPDLSGPRTFDDATSLRRSGRYRVDAYIGRHKLASTEFVVSDLEP